MTLKEAVLRAAAFDNERNEFSGNTEEHIAQWGMSYAVEHSRQDKAEGWDACRVRLLPLIIQLAEELEAAGEAMKRWPCECDRTTVPDYETETMCNSCKASVRIDKFVSGLREDSINGSND